ncbi:hypothetical protein RYZ26_10285 [Terasakiella sp. A23]|uniref:hypothetical protein n=1 Tax=Terasakiella sp. FCG-A23 TaxID=3080561 RepID=UPI00295567A3|nr:hypothetical protein [Terasakiella sp. A23]MDV7339982.1 hypothetical protein [Terasakiella sp. A23]
MKKLIALFALTLSLTACQAHQNMEFSAWHDVDKSKADINFPDISPVSVTSVSHQDRDNAVRNSKYTLEYQNGLIHVQRVIGAWFNAQTDTAVNQKEAIFKLSDSLGTKINIDQSSFHKIDHRNVRSTGYYAYGTHAATNRECIVARGGYRLRPTAYDNDMNYVDTIVDLFYCDKEVRSKDFDTMFRNLKLNGY